MFIFIIILSINLFNYKYLISILLLKKNNLFKKINTYNKTLLMLFKYLFLTTNFIILIISSLVHFLNI